MAHLESASKGVQVNKGTSGMDTYFRQRPPDSATMRAPATQQSDRLRPKCIPRQGYKRIPVDSLWSDESLSKFRDFPTIVSNGNPSLPQTREMTHKWRHFLGIQRSEQRIEVAANISFGSRALRPSLSCARLPPDENGCPRPLVLNGSHTKRHSRDSQRQSISWLAVRPGQLRRPTLPGFRAAVQPASLTGQGWAFSPDPW